MAKVTPYSANDSKIFSELFSLPEHWAIEAAHYAFDEVRDGTHDSPKPTEHGVPLITSKNLKPKGIDFSDTKFISEADHQEISKRSSVKNGDILFSMIGTVGNVAIVDDHSIFSIKNIGLFRASFDHLNPRYSLYWLRSQNYIEYLNNLKRGGNQKFVSLGILRSSPIPLPPLSEQKQIAAKLDELLAQVDTIKTRLDAIPAILKRFRQSVLAAAVCGRLTEEWRPTTKYSLLPASDDWKWPPTPDNWDSTVYPEIVKSRLGKMLDKNKNTGLPIKYLGNINVRWFGFDLKHLKEIRVPEKEQFDLHIRAGDVLICEGGEPGRSAVWPATSDKPIIFQKALHRARVGQRILPEWLVYNLKNDADSRVLEQLFTGTTIKHLTGKSLRNYPIRVPPLEEQTEIVRRVDQLFAHADHCEQRLKHAQAHVDQLTQSILAKAFRGELTADWREQNPELISGENSAQALLARIRAERGKRPPARRRRKPARQA